MSVTVLSPDLQLLVAHAVTVTLRETGGAQPEFLTAEQAARFLSVHKAYLASLRRRGKGPRFVGAGKLIRYSLPDLRRWLAEEAGR